MQVSDLLDTAFSQVEDLPAHRFGSETLTSERVLAALVGEDAQQGKK